MTEREPRRLLDDVLSEDERRALGAGRAVRAPDEVKHAVLAAVLAKAGPVGSGGQPSGGGEGGAGVAEAAGASAGQTGMSVGAWLKAFGVGGGVTAAALVGHEAIQHPPADPAPSAVVSTIPSSSAPSPTSPLSIEAVPPLEGEADEVESDDEAPVARSVLAAPAASKTRTDAGWGARWESAAVARARRQLRTGQGQAALETLAEIQARVPGGVLGQEREALTIEALAASGSRTQASRRAAAFVEKFPNSPHASRVRAYVQP